MGVTLKTGDIVPWRLLILTMVKLVAHRNGTNAAIVKPLVENPGYYVNKLANDRFNFVHGINILLIKLFVYFS